MAVGYSRLPELLPVAGMRLAATAAGIRYQGRDDLALLEFAPGSTCAAVFTRNAFCAAPVVVAREHLERTAPRYLLINSGNANAGTGERGLRDARRCCELVAVQAGCASGEVLPFSTGVIGEYLPVERFDTAMPALFDALAADNWKAAAEAIMTTDTVAKGVSRTLEIGSGKVTVTGIAKGAGMIRPDMATMLAFIATDAGIDASLQQGCLKQAVERSFNRITVDGDTSTNDACVLVATGQSGVTLSAGAGLEAFGGLLAEVCEVLAQLIVRDAEGASKFVTIDVSGGRDAGECLQVAYTVAHSPLVKTALYASDPNWGRILAAVGRAGLPDLDIDRIVIRLGDVCIVRDGGVADGYREENGQRVMGEAEITIGIELGRGTARECIWTSDLSHDYVTINAEYRT